MMILSGPWTEWAEAAEPSAVTIGVFDGVHRGHRALIGSLNPDLTRTVLTFDPHPLEVLRPGANPRLITTVEERLPLLRKAGVAQVGILDLGEIKDLEPQAFVDSVLVDKLRVGQLVVGSDFRFGKDRAGDVDLLRGDEQFEVTVIDLIEDIEGVVSSSRIRSLIEAGRMTVAAEELGSRFTTTGVVMGGDRRGREIGFPTANFMPPARKVIPAIGIYAALAHVEGDVHEAAVNVGTRPTFGAGELLIEAFLLDFDADLYGKEITIEFVEYIRPELKFASVEDLVTRMNDDVERTRAILGALNVS